MALYTVAPGGSGVVVEMDVTALTNITDEIVELVVRASDDNDYVKFAWEPKEGFAELVPVVNGTDSEDTTGDNLHGPRKVQRGATDVGETVRLRVEVIVGNTHTYYYGYINNDLECWMDDAHESGVANWSTSKIGIHFDYGATAASATTGSHIESFRAWAPWDRGAPVLGYNWGPNNVRSLSGAIEGQEMANYVLVTGLGQAWFEEDLSSAGKYGRRDDIISLSDVPDPSLLQAMAAIETQLRSVPRETLSITLDPTSRPVPFVDLNLGEEVILTAQFPVDDELPDENTDWLTLG
jgi:hypothetical protein